MTEENNPIAQELEQLKKDQISLTGELEAKNQRIAELEQNLVTRDTETLTLNQNITGLKNECNTIKGALNQAVTSYRTMTVKANPEIPAELITGDSIEAIDKATAGAREIVGKVKEKIMTVPTQVRVPAGAPPRTPPDLSGLSPREKIQQGIGKRN